MTYTHITTDELVLIESYYYQNKKVIFVAKQLKQSRQTIYNVYNALNDGLSILDYYQRYKTNKKIAIDGLPIYLITKKNISKRKWFKVGPQMWLLVVLSFLFLVLFVLFIIYLKEAILMSLLYQ
ncbi:hypothetical protein G314FT_08120 [Vagococcus luciliae]|uniref:Transposase IS30-like HTH domain-containing protein n=1 Tax=Vagococcus luciliae TaxID=2920380 RepID=A0ABY5NYK7_9ENTE|nr:hypothetical protein G314FT_08120 [Vagococcus luciliae]